MIILNYPIVYKVQIDRNREKFGHISDGELNVRKRFASDIEREINGTVIVFYTLLVSWS